MKNPTGKAIRNDSKGQGHYGARRGRRLHKGTDYLSGKGDPVFAPISGVIARRVQVYADDTRWVGVEITGERVTVKLFYVVIAPFTVGTTVDCGDVIGVSQDISEKYGDEMLPHVHLEITNLDPECLMEV